MKKTNLLIVIGLSLVIGGSALNITANFNNEETKTTQPKKANENLLAFNLELSSEGYLTNFTDIDQNTTIYARKEEFSGYNNALQATMEAISQIETYQFIEDTTKRPRLYRNEINPNTNMLIKYQITPYRYLYESKTEQTIRTGITLISETETPTIINLKITAITSKEDLSNYMGQASWYTPQNNYNIIEEITNPQNEQTYNKETQIIELTLGTEKIDTEIITNLNVSEETNYHFILIEPYINENSANTWQNLKTANPYVFMNIPNSPKISGYLIPPIQDYEVIDLPNLLFSILTMPFAFISQAFNITLFPGTPYQINISNLFLTILAILIFVFIVKLFVNK